ncbi:MAG: hypothetical protein GEU97_12240 [Actinophytocola sp.]|nr:hypothetical protein [Actinophytocola sp.]
MSTSPRVVLTALLLGSAAALASCGDDEAGGTEAASDAATSATSSSPAPTTTSAQPEPEQLIVDVINGFHRAVDANKGTRACRLLTSELQGVYAQNPGASDCPGGIQQLHDELGKTKLSTLKFASADVEVMKKGKEAVVSHERIAKRNGTNPEKTNSYNLERERGGWKISYIG